MSAIGFLAAPVAFDFARSFPSRLDTMDWTRVNTLLGEMEAEGEALLTRAGVDAGNITHRRAAEMRYVGQGHEVRVTLPLTDLSPDDLPVLREAFEAEYVRLYGRMGPPVAVEAITWRVISAGPRPELHMAAAAEVSGKVSDARKGSRKAYMPEDGGMTDVPVYDRYKLGPGARFRGPAIIEERESTTVIGPRADITVDTEGNLVVEVQEPHAR
jgi:N-methylhydantoinase A/oxoprolinase/acetone carboxylase beta subunit